MICVHSQHLFHSLHSVENKSENQSEGALLSRGVSPELHLDPPSPPSPPSMSVRESGRLSTNTTFTKMAALYSSAAQIVDKIVKKQGTAKALAINSRFPRKKKLYALVCETFKCKYVTL